MHFDVIWCQLNNRFIDTRQNTEAQAVGCLGAGGLATHRQLCKHDIYAINDGLNAAPDFVCSTQIVAIGSNSFFAEVASVSISLIDTSVTSAYRDSANQ
jgi:hypothetical protein